MNDLNCSFLNANILHSHYNRFKITSKTNWKFTCFTMLFFLFLNIGTSLANDFQHDPFLSIQKLNNEQKATFEIGQTIIYKLRDDQYKKWHSKIIKDFNIEENQLIFENEELAISAIDKIVIPEEITIGKWLMMINSASVALVGEIIRIRKNRSSSVRRTIPFNDEVSRLSTATLIGLTALATTAINIITGFKYYHIGKHHKLQIITLHG